MTTQLDAPVHSEGSGEGDASATAQLIVSDRGILSIGLGLLSLVLGWTIVVPLIGVCLGVAAGTRQPASHGAATWGVVLNAFALSVWVVIVMFSLASSFMWAGRA
ncbi:hypothetical protein ITJ44_15415 [Clavibacter sp. VKM Ac-2873]|uniref:hypothetical protein n=1 Tax=Clavibacter sp. VKM Ac-2873 TaxID=2783813 RepID=UPI00188B8FF2|nr:hypothetical protein [Clavibacter sp. VKM Ac-2873]MBF4619465.1 hypothetical protein [Clavibacter sp. VKM Ac-2873]